jgi:electron transport complex protein RnfB
MATEPEEPGRRAFLSTLARGFALGVVGVGTGALVWKREDKAQRPGTRWQIDPFKCNQCGRCATSCVLTPSAVKCHHNFHLCGYCLICMGYFEAQAQKGVYNSGAESELCPAGAVKRLFTGVHPYYQYDIDEKLCIGCAKCVKGCQAMGNGSLYLQINHDLCVNCNECRIAQQCPANAIVRVPAGQPYLPKVKT